MNSRNVFTFFLNFVSYDVVTYFFTSWNVIAYFWKFVIRISLHHCIYDLNSRTPSTLPVNQKLSLLNAVISNRKPEHLFRMNYTVFFVHFRVILCDQITAVHLYDQNVLNELVSPLLANAK
jgi:hypothetical protein